MESTTSVSSDRKLASLVGSKSARACDNCVKRRARWYCAADDAFLCHSCDSSVHSANPLARRHDRVRLKTTTDDDDNESLTPTWHARKARTPRLKKKGGPLRSMNNPTADLVPEINWSEENSNENENEEQLLYRVPIFNPLHHDDDDDDEKDLNMMNHFLPTEMDLAEFAADVESLLGNNESFDMEGLGILDEIKESKLVKVKEDIQDDQFVDNIIGRQSFVLDFDYHHYPLPPAEEVNNNHSNNNNNKTKKKKKMSFLKLDYDGVMSAWDDHKSPWTTGERPDLDSQECWPDCPGTCGSMHAYGEVGVMMSTHTTNSSSSSIAAMANGGREARVSRYREKRRTRLFSKKIRYEVRKLNAEKRPRMKGRFVKRTNFVNVNAPAAATGFTTFAHQQ